MTKYLKPAIYAWCGIDSPFLERIQKIRQKGFEATCLWWEEDDPNRRRLRRLAPDFIRNTGLHLDNLHVPYAGCGMLWEKDGGKCVLQHIEWIRDCARHDVPLLVMHVTRDMEQCNPENGLKNMHCLVEVAEQVGVRIAIENTRYPESVSFLLRHICSPYLGLCYDSGHDLLYGTPFGALLQEWAHRLFAVHISDNDGNLDRHWLPGEGCMDIDLLARCMDWSAFKGPLMLEVVPKQRNEALGAFLDKAFYVATQITERFMAASQLPSGIPCQYNMML